MITIITILSTLILINFLLLKFSINKTKRNPTQKITINAVKVEKEFAIKKVEPSRYATKKLSNRELAATGS